MPKTKAPTAPETFASRLERCRAVMQKNRLPAYLLTRHVDTHYMTGFTGEDSAVLVTPRAVHVISDARFVEALSSEVPWCKVHLRKFLLMDEIGKVVKKLKLTRFAVQADGLRVSEFDALQKAARPVRLVKGPPILSDMRRLKDAGELSLMEFAIRMAEEAFLATCRSIKPGMTERDLAARLEFEMRTRGSSAPAFESIVAVGANASHPHARAGDRQVVDGCAILFDWGATWQFYRSDLTRVVFVGSISPRIRKIYSIVLDAQEKAIAALRPGARMCDVDAVARKVITDAGFGKQFGHGLGHGLGLEVHEAPSLSWRSEEKLVAGMVVTVEPGIYLPGVGGVRIEDDVLITNDGCKVLSRLRKDLSAAVI